MNALIRAALSITELCGLMAQANLARIAFENKVTAPRRPPSGKVRLLMTGRGPVQLLDADSGEFLGECPSYREARDLADQLECRA